MEENIEKQLENALSFAQYQSTLTQQKKYLREQFDTETIIAFNGGLFKITAEWLGSFDPDRKWHLDINGTPIKIENTQELFETAKTTYNLAIEKYGEEYQKIRKQRSVRSLTDL